MGLLENIKNVFLGSEPKAETQQELPIEADVIDGKENSEPNTIGNNEPEIMGNSGSGSNDITAMYHPYRRSNEILIMPYNGENKKGDMGKIINYSLDYEGLRLRSWQMMIESEEYALIENKFADRVIGSGLNYKLEPNTDVINIYNIQIDTKEFSAKFESIYNLYLNSKFASYDKDKTFGQLQHEAYLNSNVGGDILVVLRMENNTITIQHIDGIHLCSPTGEQQQQAENRGNTITLGVEQTKEGITYGFYVRNKDGDADFILADNGLFIQAFLLKSGRTQSGSVRGVPRSSGSMSNLKILERYKNASLKKAEELSKVVFQIVNGANSDLANPLGKNLQAQSGRWDDLVARNNAGQSLADNVKATTGNQVVNNGLDQEIKPILSDNSQLFFKDFYQTINNTSMASRGMPPDVGMSMFNGSYSASRAAIVEMKFVCEQERKKFDSNYISYIAKAILVCSIYEGIISLDGYITFLKKKNWKVTDAILNHRVVGKDVEHIDPLKEINAIRMALGSSYDGVPLMSLEDGVEKYSGASFWEMIDRISDEADEINKIKFINNNNTNNQTKSK